MSFVEKHEFAGGRTEQAMLKVAWDFEIFGVGMFEALAEMHPQHAKVLTAIATMEWFNVHYCEEFAHDAGLGLSVEQVEKLGREGAEFSRLLGSFENAARVMMVETAEAVLLYKLISKGARTPELKALGEDLQAHEPAIRDWFKSELDGKSNGGEQIFAYLERHGITREEAVIPRKRREDMGGDKQQLVLAFFANEAAADQAAEALKKWDKATEYMKLDAIGVLAKDQEGKVKQHKLGTRAGKKGMGIGIALGLIAAIPTSGLSLAGGTLAGAVGGGLIGQFFHKGPKMSDEDVARIGRELDAGRAALGVLTWDFETEAVAQKLRELGGTPQAHEVAKVAAEAH
ncbi:DUF1269 domain-containing protein [Variovorax sp. J22R115]|uniref:DUF1269 domain-containing protein n=1 Tax=Variovorax sp. J22R115 TaxID=3053509 RepID=UPI002578925C|nr:DUF1269 domain-containing protein [Variovorax sp. J22R115]MDM0048842.1 DUF1269 domain-containing protein [Variovorax sp. J22R115]